MAISRSAARRASGPWKSHLIRAEQSQIPAPSRTAGVLAVAIAEAGRPQPAIPVAELGAELLLDVMKGGANGKISHGLRVGGRPAAGGRCPARRDGRRIARPAPRYAGSRGDGGVEQRGGPAGRTGPRPRGTAQPQPRLHAAPRRPGHLGVRRCPQPDRDAPAGPGDHRLGRGDGRGGGAQHDPRPDLRAACRRHRRSERPATDDPRAPTSAGLP